MTLMQLATVAAMDLKRIGCLARRQVHLFISLDTKLHAFVAVPQLWFQWRCSCGVLLSLRRFLLLFLHLTEVLYLKVHFCVPYLATLRLHGLMLSCSVMLFLL
jgi:hypothetical protein